MDPVTAFSIAVGTLQIVDQGIKASKAVYQIYRDGGTAANQQLDHEATVLTQASVSVLEHLKSSNLRNDGLSQDQKRLKSVAQECYQLANDLLNLIKSLEYGNATRKRDRFSLFIKTPRIKPKIEKIEKDLRRRQELLNSELLVNACHGIDNLTAQQLALIKDLNIAHLADSVAFRSLDQAFRDLVIRVQRILDDNSSTREFIRNREQFRLVLDSLGFSTLHSRQETISKAENGTYEWIFKETPGSPDDTASGDDSSSEDYTASSDGSSSEDDSGRPYVGFAEWLKSTGNLFWLNGKAGSGKSTLMNFIAQHEKLGRLLDYWANDQSVIILKFFFWRAGTTEQKSLSGLLRGLLHDALAQKEDLIALFPTGSVIPAWTETRLKDVFVRMIEHNSNLRLCLLIDGLDEFDGSFSNQLQLIDFVQQISKYHNVKTIVSSRPEAPLYKAFSSYPSLRLQDLTQPDIRKYVSAKMMEGEGAYIRELYLSEPDGIHFLEDETTDKADGVFLWACLAVEELRKGIHARDTISMLKERLQFLDCSLDGIFKQQLQSIDTVHRKQAAIALRLVIALSERRVSGGIRLPHLALVMNSQLESKVNELFAPRNRNIEAAETLAKEFDTSAELLRWHCAGLLDVKADNCAGSLTQPPLTTDPVAAVEHVVRHYLDQTEIDFIHRSAFDFLLTNESAKSFLMKAELHADESEEKLLYALYGTYSMELYDLKGLQLIHPQTFLGPTDFMQCLSSILRNGRISYEDRLAHFSSFDAGLTKKAEILHQRYSAENDGGMATRLTVQSMKSRICMQPAIIEGLAEVLPIRLFVGDQSTLPEVFPAVVTRLERIRGTTDFDQKALSNLNLIQTCLQQGPAPKSWTSYESYLHYAKYANPYRHKSVKAYCWQRFLFWIAMCPHFCEVHTATTFSDAVLETVGQFVKAGADLNVRIKISKSFPIHSPDETKDGLDIKMNAELSALWIVNDFCESLEVANKSITSDMKKLGAQSHARLISIEVVDLMSLRFGEMDMESYQNQQVLLRLLSDYVTQRRIPRYSGEEQLQRMVISILREKQSELSPEIRAELAHVPRYE